MSDGRFVTAYIETGKYRPNAWDVDIKVQGSINSAEAEYTANLLQAINDLAEDCDMDCQRRGS